MPEEMKIINAMSFTSTERELTVGEQTLIIMFSRLVFACLRPWQECTFYDFSEIKKDRFVRILLAGIPMLERFNAGEVRQFITENEKLREALHKILDDLKRIVYYH